MLGRDLTYTSNDLGLAYDLVIAFDWGNKGHLVHVRQQRATTYFVKGRSLSPCSNRQPQLILLSPLLLTSEAVSVLFYICQPLSFTVPSPHTAITRKISWEYRFSLCSFLVVVILMGLHQSDQTRRMIHTLYIGSPEQQPNGHCLAICDYRSAVVS